MAKKYRMTFLSYCPFQVWCWLCFNIIAIDTILSNINGSAMPLNYTIMTLATQCLLILILVLMTAATIGQVFKHWFT